MACYSVRDLLSRANCLCAAECNEEGRGMNFERRVLTACNTIIVEESGDEGWDADGTMDAVCVR